MAKTHLKIDAETSLNKNGDMMQWQDMEPTAEAPDSSPEAARRERILREMYPQGEDESQESYEERLDQLKGKPREYWSEESIRERSLEEQYPRRGETEEEYRVRLELIGEELLKADKNKTYKSNGKQYHLDYITTEPGRKGGERTVYHGHRFEEFEPDIEDLSQVYEELFPETESERSERIFGPALADSEEARHNPDFPLRVRTPNIPDSQENLARHYIGPLRREERFSVREWLFKGFGESRYSSNDAEHLSRIKEEIERNERGRDMGAFHTAAKTFEGLFYPFVLQGFFDLPNDGEHAGIIVPSEFDDIVKGVDAAIVLPVTYEDENGESQSARIPICFGLTTGTGTDKVGKIEDYYRRRHGYADISYPSSCSGRAIEPLKDAPHFAISFDRPVLRNFAIAVASGGGDKVSQDLQYMINYQIWQQAIISQRYWSGQEGGEQKTREMAILANFFGERVKRNAKAMRISEEDANDRYKDAFRYLRRL